MRMGASAAVVLILYSQGVTTATGRISGKTGLHENQTRQMISTKKALKHGCPMVCEEGPSKDESTETGVVPAPDSHRPLRWLCRVE